MLYIQNYFTYFLAIIFTIILILRMKKFLSKHFETSMSWLITLAVVFHPLSIDSLIGPNFISGALAFWLVLEGMMFFENEKIPQGLVALFFAAICNINYILLPIYFFYIHRKNLVQFIIPAVIYCLLTPAFLFKHFNSIEYNPIKFLSYFVFNLIFPNNITIFNYSLFPIFWSGLLITFLIFILYQLKALNQKNIFLIPILALTLFGVFFKPWSIRTEFWIEAVSYSSSYMGITFCILFILAKIVNRQSFLVFSLFIFISAAVWTRSWFPNSNLISTSINSLPNNFSKSFEAKKLLAWQLLFENKIIEGELALKELQISFPEKKELEKELKYSIDNR